MGCLRSEQEYGTDGALLRFGLSQKLTLIERDTHINKLVLRIVPRENKELQNQYLMKVHILITSTLALSNNRCPTKAPLLRSSSDSFRGYIVICAYVPAALRFESVPGLTTRTFSTTYLSSALCRTDMAHNRYTIPLQIAVKYSVE